MCLYLSNKFFDKSKALKISKESKLLIVSFEEISKNTFSKK
jgi:hypothetical protein